VENPEGRFAFPLKRQVTASPSRSGFLGLTAHRESDTMTKSSLIKTWFTLTLDRPLSVLKTEHIAQIDGALAELGPFGEVRLIKQRGKLRFIQKLESQSVKEHSNE
jgi:hypothetical protein